MMLYTKYESSVPCSFRQEEFWQLRFENLFFDPVTYLHMYATNWNSLNNFGREAPWVIPVKFGQNPMSGFEWKS